MTKKQKQEWLEFFREALQKVFVPTLERLKKDIKNRTEMIEKELKTT